MSKPFPVVSLVAAILMRNVLLAVMPQGISEQSDGITEKMDRLTVEMDVARDELGHRIGRRTLP